MQDTNGKFDTFLPTFALYLWIVGIVVFVCIVLIGAGVVNISVKCFAADSDGNLYVGLTEQILVYSDERVLIRSFSSKTSRDYIFTINENDTILLTTSSQNYMMDLHGNLLKYEENDPMHQYPELQDSRTQFEDVNGNWYKITDVLGWTKIVKNDSIVVYQITTLSFLVKISLYFAVISFLFSVRKMINTRR